MDARARTRAGADGSPAMFDAIAARYDLLNRLLSLGMDRRWRARAAAALSLSEGDRALDVGAGTGDMAMEIARRAPAAVVVASDPALGMLAVARAKVRRARLRGRIRLAAGDALRLPFRDGAFAAAAIAFGIRNVPDRRGGLAEMRRVVRPGGTVAVLELARPRGTVLAPAARFYVRWVVPALGGALSSRAAYRYLRSSMQAFPAPEAFARTMEEAGLDAPEVQRLFPGACHLFVSRVPGGGRDHGPQRS